MPDEITPIETPVVDVDVTEEPTDKKGWIPKHRFDEVNNRYQEYNALGLTPGDIQELIAEYRNLSTKATEKPATPKAEPTISDEERARIRKSLLEVYPELENLPGLISDVKKTKVTADTAELQQINLINDRATALVASMFTESGFDPIKQKKLFDKIETAVANDIYTNKDKRTRLYRGDTSVVQNTYREYEADILAHVVKPAKPPTKDLAFLSGKKGLSLPASPLDEKIKAGASLTRDEQRAMHDEVFALMQSRE